MSDDHSDVRVFAWWSEVGRVITRNSDGGTSGWTYADASILYDQLGVVLDLLSLGAPDDHGTVDGAG